MINLFWNKLSGSKSLWDSRQLQKCILFSLSCVTAHLFVGDLLEFHHAEFISRQNIAMFLKFLLFLYYSTVLWEHIVLRPSCQWQKYHLKMLDHVLGCRNRCHGQSAMNQHIELESLQLNTISSLSLHYLQKFWRNRILIQTQRLLHIILVLLGTDFTFHPSSWYNTVGLI